MRRRPYSYNTEPAQPQTPYRTTEDVAPNTHSRRKILGRLGCAGLVVLFGGGGTLGAMEWVASWKFSHCDNCNDESTATVQPQQSTAKPEKKVPSYAMLDVMYDQVALADGTTGRIIAPRGSDAQTGSVVKVQKGDWLILAVGNDTKQYGRLDGDSATLRQRVAGDNPFFDYASKGYTGEILTVQFDADGSAVEPGASCTQPIYCIDPGESGEPSYRAYVLSDAEYRAGNTTLVDTLRADTSLGLGDNPYLPDPLPASQIKV